MPSCNDDKGYVDGWGNDTICYASISTGRDNDADDPVTLQLPKQISVKDNATCGFLFGSIHQTLLVVFCDGSVHAVNFDVGPAIWARLCSINDGLPTGFED
jgi:hypothetical protein